MRLHIASCAPRWSIGAPRFEEAGGLHRNLTRGPQLLRAQANPEWGFLVLPFDMAGTLGPALRAVHEPETRTAATHSRGAVAIAGLGGALSGSERKEGSHP